MERERVFAILRDRGPDLKIHAYFRVSLPILWHSIQNDLELLAEGLRRILAEAD